MPGGWGLRAGYGQWDASDTGSCAGSLGFSMAVLSGRTSKRQNPLKYRSWGTVLGQDNAGLLLCTLMGTACDEERPLVFRH